MCKPHKSLRLVASNPKMPSISVASYSSRMWDELEQMSASGHLPAFGHQGYSDHEKSFAAVRHCHGRLIYVVSGEMHVGLATEVARVRAKCAFWIPPLVRHELKINPGTMFNTVYVHMLLVSNLPPVTWRFSATPLLEQVSNSLSDIALGSKVTKRNKLLAAVLIDEVNNSRLTGV
jgi:mannose-6-phosphate isomerase-like protein (cupin superfamily)